MVLITVKAIPGDLFRASAVGYAKHGIGLTAQEAVNAFLMLTDWDEATESPILEYVVDWSHSATDLSGSNSQTPVI